MYDSLFITTCVAILYVKMTAASHYTTLGLSPTATDADIRKAYRRLALRYHPDRNPDNPAAEKKFLEVAKAYEVLGDPDLRRQYNHLGNTPMSNGANFNGNFREFDFSFEDAFRQFDNTFRSAAGSTFRFSHSAGKGAHFHAAPDDMFGDLFREFGTGDRYSFDGTREQHQQKHSDGQRCHQSLKLVDGLVSVDTVCS